MVEINDGIWYVGEFESHVFWTFHGRVKIKIFYVDGHELGVNCRDDAVEEYFNSDHVGCGRATVAWVVNAVSSNC